MKLAVRERLEGLSSLFGRSAPEGGPRKKRRWKKFAVAGVALAAAAGVGWQLLSLLPRGELDRVSARLLDAYYVEDGWKKLGLDETPRDGQEG